MKDVSLNQLFLLSESKKVYFFARFTVVHESHTSRENNRLSQAILNEINPYLFQSGLDWQLALSIINDQIVVLVVFFFD